ncbi:MAG: hypothetical protein ACLQVI_34570 [Polyangiaceae bacterium]|jgi:hypothetical protein
MSPFSTTSPLATLVLELRKDKRVSDDWRRRHEATLLWLWAECAEPGVLLDVLFLDADRDVWVRAMRAVLEEARSSRMLDAEEALHAVCDVIRAIAPMPPTLDRLVLRARARTARELEAMGYPL